MTPPAARQVAVLADLCDAVDPTLDDGVRATALWRAGDANPDLALAGASSLLHWLLGSLRIQFGEAALAELMRTMRARCGHLPDLFTEDQP